VNQRPTLQLYVTTGCPACHRAERTLRLCQRILQSVQIEVLEVGAGGVLPPSGLVGCPTTVFAGMIVALGTPDCSELADRIESLVAALG
jgi:glutaredoxin